MGRKKDEVSVAGFVLGWEGRKEITHARRKLSVCKPSTKLT